LAPLCTTDDTKRPGGRPGKLVDVLASPGSGALARDAGYDLGVTCSGHPMNCMDYGNRRLAPASHHVQVRSIGQIIYIHGRHYIRTDRRRSKIDSYFSSLFKQRRVLHVRLCAGGIEHDPDLRIVQDRADSVRRCTDSQRFRPPDSGGIHDAGHHFHLETAASHDLAHEVASDVSRPQNCHSYLIHSSVFPFTTLLYTNRTPTVPSPWKEIRKQSPAFASTAAVRAPDRIISPSSSAIPNRPSLLASQATEAAGCPMTAAPAPVLTTSPFFSKTIPSSRRSTSSGEMSRDPTTNRALDALSAIVSASFIFQSRTLLSTISIEAITPSVALNTSAMVTPGPLSFLLSTNATSPSTLGSRSSLHDIGSPSRTSIWSNRCP